MKKRRGYIIAAVVAAVFLGVVGVRQYMNYLAQPLDEVEVTDSAEVDNIVRKYGIPVSEYQINYGIVEPGQNLSVILRKHGLSLTEVHQLTEKTKGVFDVRKIRDGQAYAVFSTRDSIPQTAYFVYEESPKSYIVFDLRNGFQVTRGENPVTWERKTVGGRVESSLWVAMQQCGTNPQLALDLSNIFGWSIDFFGRAGNGRRESLAELPHLSGFVRARRQRLLCYSLRAGRRRTLLQCRREQLGRRIPESPARLLPHLVALLQQPFSSRPSPLSGTPRRGLRRPQRHARLCHRERQGNRQGIPSRRSGKLPENPSQQPLHHHLYAPFGLCQRHQGRLGSEAERSHRLRGQHRPFHRSPPRFPRLRQRHARQSAHYQVAAQEADKRSQPPAIRRRPRLPPPGARSD